MKIINTFVHIFQKVCINEEQMRYIGQFQLRYYWYLLCHVSLHTYYLEIEALSASHQCISVEQL